MEKTKMKTFQKASGPGLALALGLLVVTAGPAAAAEHDDSYGYLRVVEGPATLIQAGTNDRESAEINQPVLAGDRIQVPGRSRVEIVLADRNIVRLDGGSELLLERLAASPDTKDRATVLRLLEGNLLLTALQESYGEELPRVETPNATIYVQHYGVFRVTADSGGWSELVVRRGKAEVVTDRGSEVVRADEEAIIEGDKWANVDVRPATGFDALERWAKHLDEEYAAADLRYVDDNLRYSAAPLSKYGSWLYIGGRPYWRPVVTAGWRPYWHGRWAYTPSGLTWVSYEPWGWVPYHYGSWDYIPSYGWVWEPGYRYSPAWVYWYWGSSYAGWCPTGYYTRFYGPRFGVGFGFHYGVYGYAGGPWSYYDHWTFVPTGYFGYRHGYRDGYRDGYWDGRTDERDVRRYAVPIDNLRRHAAEMPRGIITTDTRSLTPDRLKNPDDVLRTLRTSGLGRGRADLPDVTSFVARKPDLSADLRTAVATREISRRLDGTPLKPDTLGRLRPPQEVLENRGTARVPDPGRPRVILGDDRRPDVREQLPRAGRPTTGTDGGAPRPTTVRPEADDIRRPTARPDVRTDSRADSESRPTARPDVREIPRPSRPDPDEDGGAPRPDGPRVRPRSDDSDSGRPSPPAERPSARPDAEDRRPAVRPSPRETERPEPPARRQDLERYDRSERPEPRYERPEPRYEPRVVPSRPSPRDIERVRPSSPDRDRSPSPSVRPSPSPRTHEPRPSPRTSEPSRPSERPSYRPSSPPSRSHDSGRERAREARPRPPRGRDN
jgi:FecR protein